MFLICESHPSKMPTPPSWCRWTNCSCHPWLWAKSEVKCVSLSWSHKSQFSPSSSLPSHHLGPSKAFHVETWASHGPSLSVSRYIIFFLSFFFFLAFLLCWLSPLCPLDLFSTLLLALRSEKLICMDHISGLMNGPFGFQISLCFSYWENLKRRSERERKDCEIRTFIPLTPSLTI